MNDKYDVLPKNSISSMLTQFSWPQNDDVALIRDSLSAEKLWYVTSLRAGCINVRILNSSKCRITFRAVLQPVNWSVNLLTFPGNNNRSPLSGTRTKDEDPSPIPNNAITTEDAAIHLIYSPKGERGRLLIERLLSLKATLKTRYSVDTASYKLGVHPAFDPALLQEGQREDFLVEVKNLLKDFAQFSELHSAEVMVTSGTRHTAPLPITWTFGTFRRDSNDHLHQEALKRGIKPHTPGTVVLSQSLSFKDGYIPDLVSKEKSFFELVKEWRTVDANGNTASVRSLERSFESINHTAAYVDDPRNASILEGDCVTCHISSTLRNVSMHEKAKNATFAIEDEMERVSQYKKALFSRYPSSLPPEVEALTEVSVVPVIPEYNLHQFSYFLHAPTVSKRAVNDVAFDVLYFNQMLKGSH